MRERWQAYRRRKDLERRRARWDAIQEAWQATRNARAAWWGRVVFWAIVGALGVTLVLVLGGWLPW